MESIVYKDVTLTVESRKDVTKQLDNVTEVVNQGGEESSVTQVILLEFVTGISNI
jgi:hypothetical protein